MNMLDFEILHSGSDGNCLVEKWKPIKGYEDKYEVSNLGRIKSLLFKNNKVQKKRDKILSIHNNGHNYLTVGLNSNNKTKKYYVHRLVAEAFIPNPSNYKEVNHKDENSLNNNVNNLEWCTSKYNANYGSRNKKLREVKKNKYGIKVKKYDLNDNFIEELYMCDATKIKGIYYYNLRKCCLGEYKSCGGYKWRYSNE